MKILSLLIQTFSAERVVPIMKGQQARSFSKLQEAMIAEARERRKCNHSGCPSSQRSLSTLRRRDTSNVGGGRRGVNVSGRRIRWPCDRSEHGSPLMVVNKEAKETVTACQKLQNPGATQNSINPKLHKS